MLSTIYVLNAVDEKRHVLFASSSKGVAHNWLKFHPNQVFKFMNIEMNSLAIAAHENTSGKFKPKCKVVQLWREHSLLQNLYQGLRFNKVLAMAKEWVFLDIKVCTEASLITLV